MFVRKLKCYACSGNKVNDITGMFIYCDYCGNWMGLDMVKATEETADTFSLQNYENPLQQEYMQVAMKQGEASQSKNREEYIAAQLRMHELEFKLFPKRFGPKGQQKTYVDKYMIYYKELYNEIVDEKYFDRFSQNTEVTELASKLKYTVENGKVDWQVNV